jgi:hypothetical protein
MRAVARFDLGGPPEATLGQPLDPDEWQSLLHEVRRERLVPVLDAAIRDGDLPATHEQSEALSGEVEQAHRLVADIEALLVEVATSLADADVEVRVLKGPAHARLDLLDPRLRSYADLDLLVTAEQLVPALRVLASHDFHRDLPERRPGFDRRFAKEVSLAREDGREIDVHRLLALGAVGTAMDASALWSSCEMFAVEGIEVAALDAEGRFVHACVNAALGDSKPRVVALRDVANIARSRRLDARRVAELLPPGRGAAVIERARAHSLAMLGVDIEFPSEHGAPSRWERAALRCYRAEGGSNSLELLSGALGLPRWTDRVSFLAALGLPSASYRKARAAAGRPREFATAVRELVSRRAAPPGPTFEDGTAHPPVAGILSRRLGLGVVHLDGETVIWDPDSGQVLRLDGIASLVWQHLDGSTPVAELVDDLAFAFDADREVVDADVGRLVRRLVTAGVAEWTRMEPWRSSRG